MTSSQIDAADSRDFIAEADTGARAPTGGFNRRVLWFVPLLWSVFQLWIASPLPYELGIFVVNNGQARSIHLAFAVFLAFTAFPTFKRSPRHTIPPQDWVLALVGAFCAGYLYLFWRELAARSGAPNTTDIVSACIGVVLLLEAARRSLGLPLMAVAVVFMGYVFFGSSEWLPDVIRWRGASIERAMSHFWLTSEGVFGVALGVSSGFVFLFVLFGALLNRAGAGNYFLSLAFATLGHLRGGPAKAAVIASAATGLISGSSIANVVTTGTFTIPLMKKVGFSPAKAGAVEVSSSINGVLTPPVMGAVAFLMTEYVGISYVEVVRTAIIPAAISYIALLYIVHLESLKMGLKGTSRMNPVLFLLRAVLGVSLGIIAAGSVLWLSGKAVDALEFGLGGMASPVLIALFLLVYVLLVRIAARQPDLDLSVEAMQHLPPLPVILRSGFHYLMPIFLLMYLLMVERRSPGYAAFWSACFMLLVLLSQGTLKALFRGEGNWGATLRHGLSEACEGLIEGARNMIGLACAMAVAGIIVGSVTLTGIGQVMAEFVEFLSGGNLMLMLVFVALISIVLGMGLPTTANYIVVSSLMAGVVVELGAQNGLLVPLVAVHMFVFYFGIMADVTPPVGLASFAAAAISGADPMRTGFQAFFYSIRTALLPFLFIFNTDLLLIDVTWAHGIVIFIVALIAMLVFAAGTMGWFLTRSRLWESAVLVLVALTLFRPGFWLDRLWEPFDQRPPAEIFAIAEAAPGGGTIRVALEGMTIDGREVSSYYRLPMGEAGRPGAERLAQSAGLELVERDGAVIVDLITFGGPAEQAGIDFDWTVTRVELANDRPPKEIFFLPAFLLLGLVAFMQRRRLGRSAVVTA
ncbi:TRAP transporter permease [Pararhodobacter aggregans]|uniref:C4-dicarboxylate ABC transporter n=1 Tax=Pararhodobacter aggregans TaxID=404875 RepID=A0A2T7UT31_9RHOB|nr:TRAP transporter permease [Pararhodobacter aggregans]PTX03476.1 TRAP transporter 4TM/12TM fusion protein [Pararhodobacter aggregans]PVE47766.1 C4-dicarboxylate ABC transporter [Pararhodobacter aggregans]